MAPLRSLVWALLALGASSCAGGNANPDAIMYDDGPPPDYPPINDANDTDAPYDGPPGPPPDAALGLDAGPPCVIAPVTFTNSTPVTIPDQSSVQSDLVVSGVGPFTSRVTVTTNILHAYSGDLHIQLLSPGGQRVRLTADKGGSADHAFNGTLWIDSAAQNTSDYTFAVVPAVELVPETPLGQLFGGDPNGTWTLEIDDDAAGTSGALNSWSLEITAYDQVPVQDTLQLVSTQTLAITDDDTITSTLTAGAFPLPLCRIRVTTEIAHTYTSDLTVTLITPSSRRILLTDLWGSSYNDLFLGTLWRDDATISVIDYNFAMDGVISPLIPEYPLSAAWNEDGTGTWTLEVTDNEFTDMGQLQGWALDLTGCSCD